jgi:hypothetical protein
MTFASEPYTVFVDDLVSALTGGIVRDTFLFVPEAPAFTLSVGNAYSAGTVRIQGIAGGVNHTFQRDHPVADPARLTNGTCGGSNAAGPGNPLLCQLRADHRSAGAAAAH